MAQLIWRKPDPLKLIPREILRANAFEIFRLLIDAGDWIAEMIECGPGDDHHSGVCDCQDRALLERIRDMVLQLSEPEAWAAEQRAQLQIDQIMQRCGEE